MLYIPAVTDDICMHALKRSSMTCRASLVSKHGYAYIDLETMSSGYMSSSGTD